MSATMDVLDVDGEEGIGDPGIKSPPGKEEMHQKRPPK